MTKRLCQLLGVVLLSVGVLGFAKPDLLGMHLTLVHNVVHVVSGALALYIGSAAPQHSRTFCAVFGTVYLLLGLIGLAAPDVVASLIGHPPLADPEALMPDNLVHVLLGGVFLFAGLASARVGASYPPRKTAA
jgi:hypothetical protein